MNPCTQTFEELKKDMVQISPCIYKKVLEEGGPELPEFAEVKVHYNAYLERTVAPLDSTYLQGRPLKFILGADSILPGLQDAISTMRRCEESQFIISWQVLYGEYGSEPRIPAKADALFIIKLLNFEKKLDIVSPEEAEASEFFVRFTHATTFDGAAKSAFRRSDYRLAASNYLQAVEKIEFARLKDEHEERAQKDFLCKLFLNLAVCYNKLENPKKACTQINKMREIKSIHDNPKALYQEGVAKRALNEYEQARKCLLRAAKLSPDNRDITHAIQVLDQVESKYKKEEREIWINGLGIVAAAEEKALKNEDESPVGSERIKSILGQFCDSDDGELTLPSLLTDVELAYIRSLEDELSIKLETYPLESECVFKITKVKRANNPFRAGGFGSLRRSEMQYTSKTENVYILDLAK